MKAQIVLTTFSDAATAREVARQLVEARLVACATLLPGATSIYQWKGNVEEAGEVVVLFKTTRYSELEARLRAVHPYEVPEILGFKPDCGLAEYLGWIDDECR